MNVQIKRRSGGKMNFRNRFYFIAQAAFSIKLSLFPVLI